MLNTLISNLQQSAQNYPDKLAIVLGESELTYGQLWKHASGVAYYLIEKGLKKEDRVSLLIDNSQEYVVAYYGVLMAGGSVIGLNTAAKSRDIVNWINHSESSFVFAHTKHNELENIYADLHNSGIKFIFTGGKVETYKDDYLDAISIADNPPEVEIESSNMASLIYTSGTTGHPKGVMLSHGNLYNNVNSILEYLNLTNNDSIVNILPFYYSYGNSVLHIHLAVGGTIYLENSMLYPQKILRLIQDKKVTGFSGVPSTFNLLLNRTRLEEFDLSSIRYLTQAGGAMAPASIDKVKHKLPHVEFFVMYGQTEASARLSYLPSEMLDKKIGSIGVPIPGVELELRNNNHELVAQGETGEIYAKGKNIMLGYWRDNEATKKVIYDGWLMTGDLAYQDEDGFFYIVGRSSEMIKSGAHRISPKDIEEVLMEISGVEEVAVIGIEDEMLGQVIKAFIVKAPGADLDKMKIMRHCKLNLANYKMPKHIEFADEIPRTASGKVRRFLLQ